MPDDPGTSLFRSDHNSVTLFRSEVPNGECVVFFSPFGQYQLGSKIGGSNPLLRAGYDVVCVQSDCDDWHQGLPEDAIIGIAARLTAEYAHVYGYGSSMGGYAAIALHRYFHFRRILALSPQFQTDAAFDTRWQKNAGQITWRYRIDAQGAPKADICLVYDPYDKDRIHAEKICAALPFATITEVRIFYGSHPVTVWLNDAGVLKDFMLGALAGTGPDQMRPDLRCRNATHLLQMSRHALRRGKPRLALALARRILTFDMTRHEVYRQISDAQVDLGDAAAAAEASLHAIDRVRDKPTKAAHLLHLYRQYMTLGATDLAGKALDQAIGHAPEIAIFHFTKSHFLVRSKQFPAALEAAQKALSLGRKTHDTYRHISNLQNILGDKEHAVTMARHAMQAAPGGADKESHRTRLISLLKECDTADSAAELLYLSGKP